GIAVFVAMIAGLLINRGERRDQGDIPPWRGQADVEIVLHLAMFELQSGGGGIGGVPGQAAGAVLALFVGEVPEQVAVVVLTDEAKQEAVTGVEGSGQVCGDLITPCIAQRATTALVSRPFHVQLGALGGAWPLADQIDEAAGLYLAVERRHRSLDELDVIHSDRRRRTEPAREPGKAVDHDRVLVGAAGLEAANRQ